jgi:predicted dehydrogenase
MRRDINNAKESAEKLGATKWYDNADSLLSDDNVDAVYIASPPGLHLEQAIKCCEHRKPTYIEKPFARNYSEALQITKMFEEAGVPLYVAHYRRALPKFIKIKEILDSGKIGKICEADFRLNRKYNYDEIHNTWLYNTELSGGGKFYDIAPHSIDIMVYLLGNFTEINSFATNNNDEYDVEDVVVMSFKTDKGVIGTANFNSLALDKKDRMIIYGTKGNIEFTMHGNDPIIINTENGEEKIEIENPPIIQESMVEEVVKSLLTGEKLHTCSAREALETYRIMDAVLEKYYNGREDEFWKRTDTWNKHN